MFPQVIFFYCFCGGPLVVEAPGQLPSLPPLPLNPALIEKPVASSQVTAKQESLYSGDVTIDRQSWRRIIASTGAGYIESF